MDLDYTDEQQAFRQEVRSWLEKHVPGKPLPSFDASREGFEAHRAWERVLAEGLPAWHHIGLYAYRVSFLRRFPSLPQGALERFESLEQLRAMEHGHVIVVHRASHPPAAGVDTPADLERVRLIYAKQT